MFNGVLTFKAPSGADLKSLPTRILIVPWGKSETSRGVIICNAVTLRELPRLQGKLKRDRIALDFQHNTVEGSPTYKGEPVKVAAYGSLEIVEGEGIYLSAIEWTPEGKEAAQGGHYPDISPAIVQNKSGEVIFIHSAGIVRQGEIDGLTLFAAPIFFKTFNSQTQTSNQENTMDYKSALIALLGLEPDADDNTIQEAVKALAAKNKPEPTKDKDAPAGDDKVDVKALAATVKALEGKIVSFNAQSDENQRQALVAQAANEGKVIPLSADELKDAPVKILSAMISKLPVTVPVEKRTPGQVEEFSANIPSNRSEILKNCGVSEEVFKKHN